MTETSRRQHILDMLVEEYEASGHETFEHMGHVFARMIFVENGTMVGMTDIDLTRLAAALDRRLP